MKEALGTGQLAHRRASIRRALRRQVLGWLLLLPYGGNLAAEEVLVAVASNFTAPMQALSETFQRQTGHDVQLAFGSSGRFFAQISNGAPYQLFFSADQAKPQALVAQGLAEAESRFTYAVGGLVLWSADADRIGSGVETLAAAEFERLAIANPRLAPYGLAAIQVLQALELEESLQGKLVQGENIAQAYQFIASANANLGFVARSQVMSNGVLGSGSAWSVPSALHEPIRQDAVLLRNGLNSTAARELLRFVASEAGQAIVAGFGYVGLD